MVKSSTTTKWDSNPLKVEDLNSSSTYLNAVVAEIRTIFTWNLNFLFEFPWALWFLFPQSVHATCFAAKIKPLHTKWSVITAHSRKKTHTYASREINIQRNNSFLQSIISWVWIRSIWCALVCVLLETYGDYYFQGIFTSEPCPISAMLVDFLARHKK